MQTPTKSFEVIELLTRYGVDFMVVGMTAGVLHGAPAVTFDLDILHSRAPENVDRLFTALEQIDASAINTACEPLGWQSRSY